MKTIIVGTIFLVCGYLLYRLLLKNDNHIEIRRIYLLFCLVFSMIIPFITYPSLFTSSGSNAGWLKTTIEMPVYSFPSEANEKELLVGKTEPALLFTIIAALYFVGVLISSICFIHKMIQTISLVKKSSASAYPHIRYSEDVQSPFSFFKYIIINKNRYTVDDMRIILLHEKTHVKQKHSVDIMLMEIMKIVQWFNPIIYLYNKELKIVHEYLADKKVLQEGINKKRYLNLLYSQIMDGRTPFIVNNFNFSITKKRITMMTTLKKSNWIAVKLVATLPVFFLLTVFNSRIANAQNETDFKTDRVEKQVKESESEPVRFCTQMPEYVGGTEAMYRFLTENIRYPEQAKKEKVEGMVLIQFIVEKDGSISNGEILVSLREDLDAEALRVVNRMPKWKPGTTTEEGNEKPLRVYYSLPIRFSLQ